MKTNLEMPERIYIVPPRPAARSGKRWTEEEVEYLKKAVLRGDHLFRICDLMSRPYQGVLSKLQHLRYITWEGHIQGHQWLQRKVRRNDPIPRARDTPICIRPSDAKRLYCICKEISEGLE